MLGPSCSTQKNMKNISKMSLLMIAKYKFRSTKSPLHRAAFYLRASALFLKGCKLSVVIFKFSKVIPFKESLQPTI